MSLSTTNSQIFSSFLEKKLLVDYTSLEIRDTDGFRISSRKVLSTRDIFGHFMKYQIGLSSF